MPRKTNSHYTSVKQVCFQQTRKAHIIVDEMQLSLQHISHQSTDNRKWPVTQINLGPLHGTARISDVNINCKVLHDVVIAVNERVLVLC